jgi:hypothetical protein
MKAITVVTCLAAAVLTYPGLLFAFDFDDPEPSIFSIHGEVSNLLLWRSDRDFDPTIPFYEEEGQSVGGVTSFVKSQLAYRPVERIELFYEGELGLNIYSRNNPDQWFPASTEYVAYKHREFWSRFELDLIDIKVGYQRVRDPSDLFLSHWLGAVRADLDLMRFRMGIVLGQLPDSTYEGLEIRDNNFVHDNVLTGLTLSYDIVLDTLSLETGSYFMYDNRLPRKELFLTTPYLGVTFRSKHIDARLFGMLQSGVWKSSGVANIDQNILAWAVQARASLKTEPVTISLNSFLLSPDDRHHGNKQWGAFFYSGKNSSATMMLTEDEIRDRYDNFDEVLSRSNEFGSFFVNRAGLSVTDLSISGNIGDWFFPQLIGGVGFVLESANALGRSYAGFEADLILRVRFLKIAELIAVAQVFLPGEAAAPFVNDQDMTATEHILGFQFGTALHF